MLHCNLDRIKSIPHVFHVDSSELVKVICDNALTVIDNLLNSSNSCDKEPNIRQLQRKNTVELIGHISVYLGLLIFPPP
ncbi:MAG: hypothetical protein M3162_02075 [Thermoproteota archaeon]|nr:hypothetical protein [Thermoproteota archaeon]